MQVLRLGCYGVGVARAYTDDPSAQGTTVSQVTLFGNQSGADISECGRYRYRLWRPTGGSSGTLVVIGLNPSTADETENDPTISRLCVRACRLGFAKLMMLNLFAWRDTDPAAMMHAVDPVGSENDRHLLAESSQADMVLCAWGTRGGHRRRDAEVLALLRGRPLHALRLTKDGHPEHPLYLPYALKPVLYRESGGS